MAETHRFTFAFDYALYQNSKDDEELAYSENLYRWENEGSSPIGRFEKLPETNRVILKGTFLMTNNQKSFQQKQLEELRSGEEGCYDDASIYTILLDLCEGNGVEEVFVILHNVACDMGQRAELESRFYDAKAWKWDNETV